MLIALKWMDNLQKIEFHEKFATFFFIFNLKYCKFVALKENTLTQ